MLPRAQHSLLWQKLHVCDYVFYYWLISTTIDLNIRENINCCCKKLCYCAIEMTMFWKILCYVWKRNDLVMKCFIDLYVYVYVCVCFGFWTTRNVIFIWIGTLALWGGEIATLRVVSCTLLESRYLGFFQWRTCRTHRRLRRGRYHTCVRATTTDKTQTPAMEIIYTHETQK